MQPGSFRTPVLAALMVLCSACERGSAPAADGAQAARLDSRPAAVEPADRLGSGDWELTVTSATPSLVDPDQPDDPRGTRGPHDFGHRVRCAGGRIRVTFLESMHDSFASDRQSEAIARLVGRMDWKHLALTQGAGVAGSRTYVLKLTRAGEQYKVSTCGVDCCAQCARLLELVREVSGRPRL